VRESRFIFGCRPTADLPTILGACLLFGVEPPFLTGRACSFSTSNFQIGRLGPVETASSRTTVLALIVTLLPALFADEHRASCALSNDVLHPCLVADFRDHRHGCNGANYDQGAPKLPGFGERASHEEVEDCPNGGGDEEQHVGVLAFDKLPSLGKVVDEFDFAGM
jgi:hypothetical protein